MKPAKAQDSDLEYGLLNITSGAIIGGIGAIINKEPDEKIYKVFLKGFSQGALGGYLVFESKRLIRQFGSKKNYAYVWPSNLLNAAGTSIIENGAANRNFGEHWHINIGFNRIEFNTREKFHLRYRIMPFALAGIIETAFYGRFDFHKSIKTGFFIFNSEDIDPQNSGYSKVYGQTSGANSILILNNELGENALPHEIIHVYQYEALSGFNNLIDKKVENLSKRSRFWKNYNHIFYTDLNYLVFSGSYFLFNPNRREQLQNNLYEREAEYFKE
ncbi:hypothetical protein RM553_18920 [Zunongwangia sp. F363]|uniref:Uncharacterized protein n=1 Tax=Autumnicola tepida TaxID=3075595 RepID=A0ABU3CEY6_9FLAO|nr:hypothetical protein [Zunongwangia sp. F363]MDT0644918.1 hypothetical protein [Zunongwangia sp. F363]